MERIISANIASREEYQNIEEERLNRKTKLAAAFRVFAHYNFDEGIAGHITVRDPEFLDTFWVNPFGMYFGNICVSDLIRVDKYGKIIEGKHSKLNKAAFILHSTIHIERPEINAVAHAHSIYGRIFSATGQSLKPLTIEATPFYKDHVLYDDVGGVYNEIEEGKKIARALRSHKAMILRNHGLLTVGKTVDEAAWWFIAMERSCQTQILASVLGEPIEMNQKEAQRGYDELGNEDAGFFQFQPLYQKIVKEQPDFTK